MKESLNMPRPFYGYHSLVKVHQTSRYITIIYLFFSVKLLLTIFVIKIFRPAPELEKPGWLLDERGQPQGKADHLPDDFPRDSRGPRLGNSKMYTHG